MSAPAVIDFDDIDKFGVASEGYTEWDSYNPGIFDHADMTRKNIDNRARADQKTGVYVVLEDIHAKEPELIAPMVVKSAERWCRLLEKAFSGKLDRPKNSPSYFPPE